MENENAKPKPHPFDVTLHKKGDWISPDECEEAAGTLRSDRRYPLKLLGLSGELERQWFGLHGEIITTRCEKDGIRICADEEAIDVNTNRRKVGVRVVGRSHIRMVGVDRENLSPEARARHEREVVIGGATISGIKGAVQVALRAHQRNTPCLLKSDK